MLDVNISIGVLTILLFGTLIVTLFLGLPLAFALGGTAVLFTILFWGPSSLFMFPSKALGAMTSIVLVAIPLFIFMGSTLARSGLADELYEMAYHWIGKIKGGLAIGTIGISAIFASMCGSSAPATVTMGIVALPSMLKRRYEFNIVLGSIAAGGALGILIPPSITMIVYCLFTNVSVGHMFAGGILPGLMLTFMYIIYIGIRCYLQPRLGPPIPREEIVCLRERISMLRAVLLPLIVVVSVLGSIYTGIATPTEAAAVGAFGSIIVAAIHRKLNREVIWEIVKETARLTTMVMWLVIAGLWFASVYQAIGASQLILELIQGLPFGRWVIMLIMQFSFFVLGMLMDSTGIIFICMPIYIPIIHYLGFDPLWFGVLFIINMEMSYLTPPFGLNLFYLKALVPENITMVDIIRSCLPFILIQAIGLIIVMIFPQIVLWLPSILLK
jgi:tripartite ATP-independent transporter DctM subunit